MRRTTLEQPKAEQGRGADSNPPRYGVGTRIQALYQGARWVEAQGKPMSELGRQVAEVLGAVYQGIYHVSHEVGRTDWSRPDVVEVVLAEYEVATFDAEHLSRLVILCHDACVRLAIRPCMRNLRLVFTRRRRDGCTVERHPTIEEAIERARKLVQP